MQGRAQGGVDIPMPPFCDANGNRLISDQRARIAALEGALRGLLDRYVQLVDCGDCGSWNPREEDVVIAATTALSTGEQP